MATCMRLAMLCDVLTDATGLAHIKLQSSVASLRRKTFILFQIKQTDIGAPSFGGGYTTVTRTVLCRYRYCGAGADYRERARARSG